MPVFSQQIFLASRTEEENFILRRKLQPLTQEFSPLQFVSAHPQGIAPSVDRHTALVVMNFNEWTGKEIHYVDEVKGAGFKGSIVLMAKLPLVQAVHELGDIENLVFVEKPFESKDLLGILRKLLEDRMVGQQVHRRYSTSQEAEVEFESRREAEKRHSRLFNLSKGGAYLEFATPTQVRVGELLRLKLELKEVNRTYTMPAKVVWSKKATSGSGTGVGVAFVGPGDVQKLILGPF